MVEDPCREGQPRGRRGFSPRWQPCYGVGAIIETYQPLKRPVNKDKDRIVVTTFSGLTKNVRWYCPKDCGNGGMKGILGKTRKLLRMG